MVTFTEAFNVVCRMVSTDSVGSIGASICELIHKQSKWSQEASRKRGIRKSLVSWICRRVAKAQPAYKPHENQPHRPRTQGFGTGQQWIPRITQG